MVRTPPMRLTPRVWSECEAVHLTCGVRLCSWDLSALSDVWWYHTDEAAASKDAPVVEQEPKAVFESRMAELIKYLQQRPEQTIALVCHWGVILSITGQEFENCEMRSFEVEKLKPLSVFAE